LDDRISVQEGAEETAEDATLIPLFLTWLEI
jgi:hypothetical protein